MSVRPVDKSPLVFLFRSTCQGLLGLILAQLVQAQEPSQYEVRFETENHHPSNATLERLQILKPSLRVNDFTRSYSAFDAGSVNSSELGSNDLFQEDIRYRFLGRTSIALTLEDSGAIVSLEPILGYEVRVDKSGQLTRRRSNGLKLSGHIGDHVAFHATAVDNLERGRVLDRRKELDPFPGFVIGNDQGTGGFDFDEAQVQIGFHWSRAELFFEKLRTRWGYGESSSVVLSEKAPSYPQVRLVVNIASKLRLTSLHAALYSNVIDSLASYSDPNSGSFRKVFRKKYLAAHVLEYAPSEGLNLALGESVMYSDRFEPMYLLPLLFYRSAEHQNRDTDNAQLFLGIRYSILNSARLYGTLFIDDLNVDKMFSEKSTSIIAWTIGGRFIDVWKRNLDVTLEYTRLNPWVYTHKFAATDYTSDSYVLGHWLGQNADLLFGSIDYRWIRPLSFKLSFQKLRKGPLGPNSLHYTMPWAQKFLEGELFRQTIVGLGVRWEIYRYLFMHSEISLVTQSDDVRIRFPDYSGKIFANIQLSYNLFQ